MKGFLTICTLFVVGSLLTFTARTSAAPAPEPDGSAAQLIESLGCRGCHRIQGNGGSLATDLTTIGTRLTTAEIVELLTAHTRTDNNQLMPSYSTLSTEEINKLSSYLYNQH